MGWTTVPTQDGTNDLCKATYKINSDNGGFTFSCWHANMTLVNARAAATDIGLRILQLLPQDAEIFRATLYHWDGVRNSFALRSCRGKGNFGNLKTTPTVENCDNVRSAILIRMEDIDGGVVPRVFNLVPDSVTVANDLLVPVTDVVGFAGPVPPQPVLNDTYAVQFNAFMQALTVQTHHVKKGAVPGGRYQFKPFTNCFVEDVTVKRGGRVFIG